MVGACLGCYTHEVRPNTLRLLEQTGVSFGEFEKLIYQQKETKENSWILPTHRKYALDEARRYFTK